jgi:hypothetical protein
MKTMDNGHLIIDNSGPRHYPLSTLNYPLRTQRSRLRHLRAVWYVAGPSDEDMLAGVCTLMIVMLVVVILGGL